MRAVLLLTVVALSLVGCNPTTISKPTAPSPPPATALPTRTPLINVAEMMGAYPQQTVFVATTDHVSAVTLLNHFTRYRIPTSGVAHVSSDPSGRWLYVLDAEASGAHRLRAFDVSTGTQRAALSGIADVAEGGHALVTASDGNVLVLKSDPHRAWVEAFEALSLRPLGVVMERPSCGDRLLSSNWRIAIVCRSTGQIALDNLRGNHADVEGVLPDIVASAMAEDGTLYVATADEHLASVAAGASSLVSLAWPSEWSGVVLSDALAVAQGGTAVAIAERTEEGAWLRVLTTTNTAQRTSLRLAGVPRGGVLVRWPFAYYTVDDTVRHVDLTTGLLETMTDVGPGAVPAAVVNG